VLGLARPRPRLIAPAMNPGMLAQPSVRRNLAQLREDGWILVEPESGHMACGDEGLGRLPEPATLVQRVTELLRA
jgi:phosphopantothenoylcysteine decarboxylase / phosphopantothenate---cysteine ligase